MGTYLEPYILYRLIHRKDLACQKNWQCITTRQTRAYKLHTKDEMTKKF